jgi:hypothetical protein
MNPIVILLLAVGVDRLLTSTRPRRLEPARRWWPRTRPRLVAGIRSAPATYTYLAILFVTTWVLANTNTRLADRLLLAQSTNLHQLARYPTRVLVSSAFWLSGTSDFVVTAVVLTLVLAPVERRIGAWRMGSIFAIGHVGATLITAAGLSLALHFEAVERNVVYAQDIGASYGFIAVAAALTYLLVPRLRWPYTVALVCYIALTAAVSHTFTDFGHLAALLLGFACYPLVARAPRRSTDPVGSASGAWPSPFSSAQSASSSSPSAHPSAPRDGGSA